MKPSHTLRPWKTLVRQTLLEQGKFLTVERHTVELPDGLVIDDWSWVVIPDAVIVTVQRADGRFLCFRQTKYAISGETLAPAAGMISPGEDPLAAAQRELREEMGCEAAEWIPLGSYCLDPNRGVNICHLYLARGALQVAKPDSDDLEDQELVVLTRKELEAALLGGEFKAIMWVACVAMALQYLSDRR